ncbi:outer membrane protein assembly factor BamB family protein [Thermococcus stetteri]|uniref:outer membrane protein assembly factor BamB family protein n=1 Tax=Thermococcus stetteri TaxID=49900 RepID=UPI001FD8060C|nr:PQQ-binding-like beta-propeller repeat protein [Thermococcus stetteri]
MRWIITMLGLSLVLVVLFLPAVSSSDSPVLWKGSVCTDVPYQKTIEAVAITNSTIYAACSYRQVTNSSGLIGVYYLGTLSAYSLNGSKLWENSSGYVVKLYPLDGSVLVDSLGGLVLFDNSGRVMSVANTVGKLYDFTVKDTIVYAVDGDYFISGPNSPATYKGHLYAFKLGKSPTPIWNVSIDDMLSRVRVGEGVIYASSGFPSGYSFSDQFGSIYAFSADGKPLWNITLGHWVRDIEVWKGSALLGTGFNNSKGELYLLSPAGKILMEQSTFYVEDILVLGDTAYVSGYDGQNGTVISLNLPSGKVLWEQKLPYRAKVLAYSDGFLLVGVGKFEQRTENGTTYIYSVGSLYLLNPKNGEIIGSVPNTGYARSIAVLGDKAVIGTASSDFYVIDLSSFKHEESICGPATIAVLPVLFGLLIRKL